MPLATPAERVLRVVAQQVEPGEAHRHVEPRDAHRVVVVPERRRVLVVRIVIDDLPAGRDRVVGVAVGGGRHVAAVQVDDAARDVVGRQRMNRRDVSRISE